MARKLDRIFIIDVEATCCRASRRGAAQRDRRNRAALAECQQTNSRCPAGLPTVHIRSTIELH